MAKDKSKLKAIIRRMKDDEPEEQKAFHGFAFVESMTRIVVGLNEGAIRVWREEKDLGPYEISNQDLHDKVFDLYNVGTFPRIIAVEVAKMPRVTAVEWTDRKGCGGVIYVSWP